MLDSLLEIVVMELDQRTKLTYFDFSILISLGIEALGGAPIPVALTSITDNPKIVTYPPLVKKVAFWGQQNNLYFKRAYAASATRLMDLFTTNSWLEFIKHLSSDQAAWYIQWGINWMCISESDIVDLLRDDKLLLAYQAVEQESKLRDDYLQCA